MGRSLCCLLKRVLFVSGSLAVTETALILHPGTKGGGGIHLPSSAALQTNAYLLSLTDQALVGDSLPGPGICTLLFEKRE